MTGLHDKSHLLVPISDLLLSSPSEYVTCHNNHVGGTRDFYQNNIKYLSHLSRTRLSAFSALLTPMIASHSEFECVRGRRTDNVGKRLICCGHLKLRIGIYRPKNALNFLLGTYVRYDYELKRYDLKLLLK